MKQKLQALFIVGAVSALSVTGVLASTNSVSVDKDIQKLQTMIANTLNGKIENVTNLKPIMIGDANKSLTFSDSANMINGSDFKVVSVNGDGSNVMITSSVPVMEGWDKNLTKEQIELSSKIPAAMEKVMANFDYTKPMSSEEVTSKVAKELGVTVDKLDGIFMFGNATAIEGSVVGGELQRLPMLIK